MKVIFVGLGGIPSGKRAIDVRIDALAKLTAKLDYKVEIINRFSKIVIPSQSSYDVYDPFAHKKRESWGKIKTLFHYILALLIEPFVILKSNKREKVNIIVTSSGHVVDIFVYKIISCLIGAKLVYEYCEYRCAIKRKGVYHKLNGLLLDHVSPKLWDGAICISHFLENACKRVNPNVVTTIVYPLCDFEDYRNVKAIHLDFDYIMFCGSVEYDKTLDVVLQSYKLSDISKTHKLLLVLRGDQQKIERLAKDNNIIVKTNLAYVELVAFLKGAQALLIPVDNSIRDMARFPNKICEYGAVGGLIITVNNGEMPFVFTDKKNALVSETFSPEGFASKLNEFCSNKNIEAIRKEGAKTCKGLFDIDANLCKVSDFYKSLLN